MTKKEKTAAQASPKAEKPQAAEKDFRTELVEKARVAKAAAEVGL